MKSSAWTAFSIIFKLTLQQTFWNKRSWGMVILASLPVGMVILQRLFGRVGLLRTLHLFPESVVYLYLFFIAMLFALFYGSAVIADDIESRTLLYLFIRPVPKQRILLSKYIAYLVGSSVMVLLSLFGCFVGIYTHPRLIDQFATGLRQFPQYALAVEMALVSYGAVYLLFGTCFRRPVLYGLFFFGWEKIVLGLPGGLKQLSIVHYLLSLLPGHHLSRSLQVLRAESVSTPAAWVVLAAITLAAIAGALAIFTRREYRMTESS